MKRDKKYIFDGKATLEVDHINAYLFDGPDIFVERRSAPLCDVPPMIFGSMPNDGGNLIIEAADYEDFIRREPRAQKFIRRFMGGDEFLNGKERYCLWPVDADEDDLRLPLIAERVEAVREYRLSSKRAATRKLAATPHLFAEIRQPATNFIIVPRVSSERRPYIPMGFMTPDVIAADSALIIPRAKLFHFAVLESSVHMAWMRTVCGRLKSDYRYSGTVVYNNFPWLTPTMRQYFDLLSAAERILEIRSEYEEMTLAEMYNEATMPDDLRAAHEENDRLVQELYGFEGWTEPEMITELLLMYDQLSSFKQARRTPDPNPK